MFNFLDSKKKSYPWPEDAITGLGRKEARLVGVRLNEKPYVGVCYLCKVSYKQTEKKKWLPYKILFENKTVKPVCNWCGNQILRNLIHYIPPKKDSKTPLDGETGAEI